MVSDPAYVTAFKDYTKSSATVADRNAMEQEFYGESDRACGILQASWVELIVEISLRGRLRDEGSSGIFDVNGPLGTFANKISLGYGLGIFGYKTRHDLNLIRLMRNGFAHCQLPLRFDTPAVKGVCGHLLLTDIETIRVLPTSLLDYNVKGGGEWHDRQHPRERYIICCYTIISGLFMLPPQPLLESSRLP
jgi:hypothetical protein